MKIQHPKVYKHKNGIVEIVYYDRVEVDTASNYYEMRRIVNKLTFHMNEVDEE